MRTAAVLLAAGASTRLGQPKQLVTIDGESLLSRSIRIAFESGIDEVFVVLGAQAGTLRQHLANSTKAELVENPDWQQGMATSIHAGVRAALAHQPPPQAIILLTCDQPAVTPFHLVQLQLLADEDPPRIAASTYADRIGVPAVFPQQYFSELLALTGDTGARSLLRAHAADLETLSLEHGELDLDTPESLAAIHQLWPA
ncbi:MAG TPA: nucleotidyltransferase family protein [Acidobacteriaceae bacterium]